MSFTWTPEFSTLTQPEWEALPAEDREKALELATASLQMLTLYRVGLPPITIRPTEQMPCTCWGRYVVDGWNGGRVGFDPLNWDGQWFNCVHCGWKAKPKHEIDIPGPVGFIDSLKINGTEVDITTGDWRLDDGHLLVWQGSGPSPIPAAQNLDRPDTEQGTWSLTYSKSYPVSEQGRIAVGLLAIQFAKGMKPKGKCDLPRAVRTVTRSGVTFNVEASLFPNGLTGIDGVDPFIMAWAPAGAPLRNATVFNPRAVKPRVTSAVPTR